MTRKSSKRQWNGPLPTTGELVGSLARMFGWKPSHAAGDSTWRKFTHGKHISEDTRNAILGEIARGLVHGAFRHKTSSEVLTGSGGVISLESVADSAQWLLVEHAAWWDGLCGRLQAAIPVKSTDLLNMVVLRLAVVELAMRGAALLLLCGHGPTSTTPAPEARRPIDVQELLLPMLLRRLLKEAGFTRERLAEELDVTKEAVDQWLARDALVAADRLDDIAEILADATNESPFIARFTLRLARAWTHVLRGVKERVDAEEPGWMVNTFVRMLRAITLSLEQQVAHFEGEGRQQVLLQLLLLGSNAYPGPQVRAALLEQEWGDDWRGVIGTPPALWVEFLGNALSAEKQALDWERIREAEGLTYFWNDPERNRLSRLVRMLVPPERLPPQFRPDTSWTPDQVLDLLGQLLQYYGSDEYTPSGEDSPPAWRMCMELAESSRIQVRSARTAWHRCRWEVLIWFGYSKAMALLLAEYVRIFACEDVHAALAFLEEVAKARRAIPQIPKGFDPIVQGIIDVLRLQLEVVASIEKQSEILELFLAQEQLKRELDELNIQIDHQKQAGLPVNERDLEAVDRCHVLSNELKEKSPSILERSRAVRAEIAARSEDFERAVNAHVALDWTSP